VVIDNVMFGLSGGHLLILLIVILIFGRNRLPEMGSALGKGISAFKKGLAGGSSQDSADKHLNERKSESNDESNSDRKNT